MTKIALGKGLSALIPNSGIDNPDMEGVENISFIQISKITPSRYQPRLIFDDSRQKELTDSIRENGIIQPIVVRRQGDKYEIIAGERRFRAAQSLGIDKIQVIVKQVSDEEALELSLIENIQRENLDPVEEAKAYRRLISEFNLSQENVALKVGKDRTTVANSLRLLKLPDDILEKISSGLISVGHAKVVLSLENPSDQKKIFDKILKDSISVRETERAVGLIKEPPVHKRKMGYKDPQLISLEEHMQRVLGTQIRICQGKKKGRIEIEYYSQDDLDRILDFFGARDR